MGTSGMVFTVSLDRLCVTLFATSLYLTGSIASAFKHTTLLLVIHSFADWIFPDPRPEVHSIGTVYHSPLWSPPHGTSPALE